MDDGSLDGSAVIAKEFATSDPRFRVVEQENRGLGPARNTGAAHSTGKYLTFVDSDDFLAPDAFERLVGSLEESGSDIACGNVKCFNSENVWQSKLHARSLSRSATGTHILEHPKLLEDRTAWNKVFRREFWDRHGFAFPPGYYEDAPVTIMAHLLAGAVDVHSETVYFWRRRENGDLSITQNRTAPGNLEDRIASIRRVRASLAEKAPKWLLDDFELSVLTSELPLYIEHFSRSEEEYRGRLLRQMSEYIATVDKKVIARLPWMERLVYAMIAQCDADRLDEVLAQRHARTAYPFKDGLLGWYADHPYRTQRITPRRVFRVNDDELKLVGRADRVEWRFGWRYISISGYSYISGIDLSTEDASNIEIVLRRAKDGKELRPRVHRFQRPDVTAASRQDATSYDWSGFEVLVDPEDLVDWGDLRSAVWKVHAEVTSGSVRRKGTLNSAWSGQGQALAKEIAPGVRIGTRSDTDGCAVIKIQKLKSEITDLQCEDGAVILSGWADVDDVPEITLRAAQRGGNVERHWPVAWTRLSGKRVRFTAKVPLADVAEEPQAAANSRVDNRQRWDFHLDSGSGPGDRIAMDGNVPERRFAVGDLEVSFASTGMGALTATVRSPRLTVAEIAWSADSQLLVSGEYVGGERPESLVLRRRVGGEEYSLPIEWTEDGFAAKFNPARMPLFGAVVPLLSGKWDLLARGADGDTPVHIAQGLLGRLPGAKVIGAHYFRIMLVRGDQAFMHVNAAMGKDWGRFAQRRLREEVYPRMRTQEPENVVVFESWRGRQYSDSPRALYQELQRRGDAHECVWVSSDGQITPPPGVRVVMRNSREHFRTMATAKYIFANDNAPEWFVKRPGQVYVQTWHGTPLKRIGLDIPSARFATGRDYIRRFSREVSKWDLLLSPNRFSTPIFQRAFGYEGEFLESGYPRNDLLHRPDRAEIAAKVRELLGISSGQKVVMYAPTWRDDQWVGWGRYGFDAPLDLDLLQRTLGDDHVVLMRGHLHNVCASGSSTVRDVSRYPDISELLLIADVLITDYSSLMFDFAATGRPMLLFTYDLEHYRDKLRGFYFDLEKEAPGPLLRDADEVLQAMRDIDNIAADYEGSQAAFVRRFCHLDDGRAAARVLDHVMR